MCGVEGGLIVYCPNEQEPMVWPSHEVVQSLLKKFYQVLEMERNKKSMKLETYYKEKASKSRDQLKKDKARSKIRSEIGLTYHDLLIATIGDDLRLPRSSFRDIGSSSLSPHIQQPIPLHSGNLSIVREPRLARFAYSDNSCATIAPRGPMPPFGYESSSSVLIANLELPTFKTFSEVLLRYDDSRHCPLGLVESNSLANDFLGNLLRFLVV
ncbi:hypothetical protein ES332_D06G110500v1 [Gossypium tomentosum]|uniref:MADS-box domain-containing protein n=1 Tax=Gossypium tomentosum TaxID=34277 RepID=A0A5D2KI33_GOSTO|nr:hypothetical protein ES332_D06G110500v1 [Gossypium tomentosum]